MFHFVYIICICYNQCTYNVYSGDSIECPGRFWLIYKMSFSWLYLVTRGLWGSGKGEVILRGRTAKLLTETEHHADLYSNRIHSIHL